MVERAIFAEAHCHSWLTIVHDAEDGVEEFRGHAHHRQRRIPLPARGDFERHLVRLTRKRQVQTTFESQRTLIARVSSTLSPLSTTSGD